MNFLALIHPLSALFKNRVNIQPSRYLNGVFPEL